MNSLLQQKYCKWIDSFSADANQIFKKTFSEIYHTSRSLVFLCIGTPLLAADRFGPLVGSTLKKQGIPNVYGTLDTPVHAENIEHYRHFIKKKHPQATIIAIDAALGKESQIGYITLRKGALKPGQAIGKVIRPIGHVEITGVFRDIQTGHAESLSLFMSHVITDGICQVLTAQPCHPAP